MTTPTPLAINQTVRVIANPKHPNLHARLIGKTGTVEQLLHCGEAIVRYGTWNYQWWRLPIEQLEPVKPIFIGVDYADSVQKFGGAQ